MIQTKIMVKMSSKSKMRMLKKMMTNPTMMRRNNNLCLVRIKTKMKMRNLIQLLPIKIPLRMPRTSLRIRLSLELITTTIIIWILRKKLTFFQTSLDSLD
jgi:hypothetical protein